MSPPVAYTRVPGRPHLFTFHHDKRSQSRYGNNDYRTTHYHRELKKSIYEFLKAYKPGEQIAMYTLGLKLGVSDALVYEVVFVDNFKEGNPAGIRVEIKNNRKAVFKI